jgi:hypothetical protein
MSESKELRLNHAISTEIASKTAMPFGAVKQVGRRGERNDERQ